MEVVLHLDTNAYSAFMRGSSDAVFIIERARTLALSPIVIGELKAGFTLGQATERNLDQLKRVLESARIIVPPLDDNVTDRYARIYKQLRRDGRPIPTNDVWIAAFVDHRQNAIFSFDSHFRHVDGLQVIQTKDDFLKLIR